METLFEHTSASWVRYSQYEWKKGTDDNLYLTPTENANPQPYDPLKDAEALVLDAMDIALLCTRSRILKSSPQFCVLPGIMVYSEL